MSSIPSTFAAASRGRLAVPALLVWPLVAAGLIALIGGAYYFGQQTAATRVVSTGPRIEDVRRIAKLAVLRVQVADVIEGTTGGARALVLVHGDADLAVDLDKITFTARDEAARTATIRLPSPRPERPRVDHQRSRVYELQETGLAALNPLADARPELLADCMRAAQRSVEAAVAAPEFAAQAKAQAEALLGGFHAAMGWTVAVEWDEGNVGAGGV